MKKMIAALAVAGLGMSLAAGAQAQTVTSNPPGTYTVQITASTAASSTNPGALTYSYDALLLPAGTTSSAFVNSFAFTFGANNAGFFIPGSETATPGPASPGDPGFALAQETPTLIQFATTPGSSGLTLGNPEEIFTFDSFQPPTGVIGITPAGGSASGPAPGSGGNFLGPGAAIPEPGSFALLGLGLLPLAMVARRRMSR